MQPKIDGMRVCFESGVARSRSWKPLGNRYLQLFAEDFDILLHGLDGEVISGLIYNPEVFRDAMSGIRAEEGSKEFSVYVFDVWHPMYRTMHYLDRRKLFCDRIVALKHAVKKSGATLPYKVEIIACPQDIVSSMAEIELLAQKHVDDGWEGSILRRNPCAYKYNRATANQGQLMKVKGFEDAEAEVIGYEPWYENANGAYTNDLGLTSRSAHQANLIEKPRLGALLCRTLDDAAVEFKIGVFRGLSHFDRDRLWEVRETLPGRICTYKHQGYGGGYDKPRTPVWLKWRDPSDL